MFRLFLILSILSVLGFAQAATIYVPDNYATIQGAIYASANGDVVIVRPGTYVENIDFLGKAITVKSEDGPDVTTIDGNQTGSVVKFQSGEGANSLLDGFTVTNGNSNNGGGIYCFDSSSTITNNTISENGAHYDGGGIYCCECSPVIGNNTITENGAHFNGGGIGCWKSSPIIANNTISGNIADSYGGGIHCEICSPTILNNTISGNTAGNGGGGIHCIYWSSPIITKNTISGNTVHGSGGAISCEEVSSPIISNNTVSRNTADGWGGGIYCYWFSSPITANNTITENSADNGGGFCCVTYCQPFITNTILWHNTAPTGPEIWIGIDYYSSHLSISYSDVEGGQSSCHVEPGCQLNWGSRMIDADPLFVDAANSDLHLSWNSPCRDTGYNWTGLPDHDIEGDPRIALGTVDMGADEFYYHIYHKGDVVPGSPIDVKVVGYPTALVTLYLGSGLADPPYWPAPENDTS